MGENFDPIQLIRVLLGGDPNAPPPLAPENDPSRRAEQSAQQRRRQRDAAVLAGAAGEQAAAQGGGSTEVRQAVERQQAKTAADARGPKRISRPPGRVAPTPNIPRASAPRPQPVTLPRPGQAPSSQLPGIRGGGLGPRLLSAGRGLARRATSPVGGPIPGIRQFSPLDLGSFAATVGAPLLLGQSKPSSPVLPASPGSASRSAAEAAERERRRLRGRGRSATFATKGKSLGRANIGATSLLGR